MVVSPTQAAQAAPPPVLLLTAGDGPWQWRRTNYMLLDGALDQTTTTHSLSSIRQLRSLGSVMRSQHGSQVTFEFDSAAAPLQLEVGKYEEAGVGASLWDASIALSLFQRSGQMPLPASAKVVELGAGLGLPSFDLARGGGVASVTLTDARSKLLELAEQNMEALRHTQPVPATVAIEHLQWGGDGETSTARGAYDVIIGSDICYEEASVPSLAALLERLQAPVAMVIGPAGRPSMKLLKQTMRASPFVHVEERLLSLVCSNADASASPLDVGADDATLVRSSGVHSLLIVSPFKP